jgi:hypothetical protein
LIADEEITVLQIISLGLILGGVYITQMNQNKAPLSPDRVR